MHGFMRYCRDARTSCVGLFQDQPFQMTLSHGWDFFALQLNGLGLGTSPRVEFMSCLDHIDILLTFYFYCRFTCCSIKYIQVQATKILSIRNKILKLRQQR